MARTPSTIFKESTDIFLITGAEIFERLGGGKFGDVYRGIFGCEILT